MRSQRLFLFLFLLWIPRSHAAQLPPAFKGMDLRSGAAVQLDTMPQSESWVIVFLSARCPCSEAHQSALAALASEFESRKFRFVGVHANGDETIEEAREHFSNAGLPFPVLRDEEARLANELGALKTPHVFVFARNELVYEGGMDDSHAASTAKKHYLRDALLALSEGRMPPQSRARALGCEIQR